MSNSSRVPGLPVTSCPTRSGLDQLRGTHPRWGPCRLLYELGKAWVRPLPSRSTDFLNDAGPFATIEAAEAAVAGWHHEYNHDRPHQSLDMATPPPGSGHDRQTRMMH